jgi:UDP-N-acetylglucosamine acyltransferase
VRVHPLAVVSPTAAIGRDVEIGPFCVVEAGAVIGDGCRLDSRVSVKTGTTLGPNNLVFEGAVLGGMPQHAHMPARPGTVVIGQGNVIRENVTVHRALQEHEATIIGDHNLMMVNVHVAHDCRVGSHAIFVNNAMLGGHVVVEDRAYVSGAVAVHQYCRIGTLAMVGGQSHVVQDVPPYVTIDGLSSLVVGLNQIGLRRAGFTTQQIVQLKRAYRLIYRSGLPWQTILDRLEQDFAEGAAAQYHRFLSGCKRGIVSPRSMPAGATIKLHREQPSRDQQQVRAG